MATMEEMYDPLNGDELLAALSRIKVEKAADSNGFLPDIVVANCCILKCHCLVQCGKRNRYLQNGVM